MRAFALGATLMSCVALSVAVAADAETAAAPEAVLGAYLKALQDEDLSTAYGHISTAMRGGKDEEAWVKETKSFMSFAEVKIFEFKVYPGKIEGDRAQVPNLLESQDRFVNALGLTEYELYTLVREDGAWKVDQQLLLEPALVPKWFPKASASP